MRCVDPCLLCYSNARGRSNWKNHYGYRKPPERRLSLMGQWTNQRPSKPAADDSSELFEDDDLKARCPALVDYLTSTKWGDGRPRQTATLHVFVDQGQLKCFLNDRAVGRSACVSASTLVGLLGVLEAGLRGDCLDWRWDTRKGKGK
jgi:hypothetical protein